MWSCSQFANFLEKEFRYFVLVSTFVVIICAFDLSVQVIYRFVTLYQSPSQRDYSLSLCTLINGENILFITEFMRVKDKFAESAKLSQTVEEKDLSYVVCKYLLT